MQPDAAHAMVVDRTYELIRWYLPHAARIPRSHRYTLGARIEERLYDLLEGLLATRFAQRERKGALLDAANLRLDAIRLLTRLAHDLKFLPHGSHEHAARGLEELGRMIGGWRKHVATAPRPGFLPTPDVVDRAAGGGQSRPPREAP